MKPNRLDHQLFERLAGAAGNRLVSFAIPTHVRGRETSQDRIRFKNQLAEIDAELEAEGVKARDRQAKLGHSSALLDDVEFWEHQSEQLAMYIDDSGDPLPIAVSRQAKTSPRVVASVYHLRHVLPELNPVRLPVLVLTEKAVRLYEAGEHDIRRIDADLPASFDDVNWFVDREVQRQQHPDRAGSSRNRHGHEASTRAEEDTARFLRAVRDALPSAATSSEMVVLGDDSLVHRFESIAGNPVLSPANSGVDDLSDAVIQERAVPELEKHRVVIQRQATSEALDRLGVGAAATDLAQALQDAVAGRIATLLINADADPIWGRFDRGTLEVDIHDRQQPEAVDLIDRLVAEAFVTGADLVVCDSAIGEHDWVAVRRF